MALKYISGSALCCGFSGIVNKLNYCGPDQAYLEFAQFLQNGGDESKIRKHLSNFQGLYPYLSLIANKHGLDPFDRRVVEAYWMGNELLDVFTREDYVRFMPELGKRGLPQSHVTWCQENLPEGAIPHHTFHVLFVGVGRVTGSVPTILPSMQNCMASWGRVVELDTDKATIEGPFLNQVSGRYTLENITRRSVSFQPELQHLKPDMMVAAHWGSVAAVLEQRQYQNLIRYTTRIIEIVNQAPRSPA